MQAPSSRESGEKLFLDHLETIEKVIRFVAANASLRDADAEDFASHVKLLLIENDYSILRQFKGPVGFTKFISIVIHRMLLDERVRLWGKWHPSSEARRGGPVAIALEKVLHRDGRTVAEALPICKRHDDSITVEDLEKIAARLPKRTLRPRPVPIESVDDELRIAAESVSQPTLNAERAKIAKGTSSAFREAFRQLSNDDQLLLRLHFGADLSLAEAARVMHIPQKPLYRRVKRCLRELRRRLEGSGITAAAIKEMLESSSELDLGIQSDNGESEQPRPSDPDGRPGNNSGGSC